MKEGLTIGQLAEINAELNVKVSALLKERDAVVAENAKMHKAIDFATAPDMWVEQHDGMLDYRYAEWYVDVLEAAKQTQATDAALADIEARGVEKFVAWCDEKVEFISSQNIHDDIHTLASASAKRYAAELRKGAETSEGGGL